MTWKHLERGSSSVDWCEGNYLISSNIAEVFNTISSFLFILLSPISIQLFRDYGYFINQRIHVIWVLLMITGLSSAYFHATLSLMGQLLDEVAILWLVSATYAVLCPMAIFQKFLYISRNKFSAIIACVTVMCTLLTVWKPAINAFALMFLIIPSVLLLCNQLRAQKCQRVRRLGMRSCLAVCVALICWIIDRLYCDFWLDVNFPYFHGFWHISICIASYSATVLLALFAVEQEHIDKTGELKYWPVDDFEFGVPYVSVRLNPRYYKDTKM